RSATPASPTARVTLAACSSRVPVGIPKSSTRIRSKPCGPIAAPKHRHSSGPGRLTRCSTGEKAAKVRSPPANSAKSRLMSTPVDTFLPVSQTGNHAAADVASQVSGKHSDHTAPGAEPHHVRQVLPPDVPDPARKRGPSQRRQEDPERQERVHDSRTVGRVNQLPTKPEDPPRDRT